MEIGDNDDDDGKLYDVNEYSESQLYDMLDLNNPSDRELEAKILMMIKKYSEQEDEESGRLETFFENVYSRFFETDDISDTEDVVEGMVTKDSSGNVTETQNPHTFVKKAREVSTVTTHTTNLEYTKSDVNPLLKETTTQIMHIQSKYRDYTTYPNSTDFNFNLSSPLKKVVSMRLHSVNIPYKWYNISNVYNANSFYLKGVSPGISGVYSFMFNVSPGIYNIPELMIAINASIANVASQNPEVDFGTTKIAYNDLTAKVTFTIDIKNVYTESSYYLHFPTASSPFNANTRNTTIPGMLGYVGTVYPMYNLYSKFQYALNVTGTTSGPPQTYNDNDVFTVVINDTLTQGNNYFTIINYQGPSNYDAATSVILDTFTVTYTTTANTYTRAQLVNFINSALRSNTQISNNSDLQLQQTSYDNTAGVTTTLRQYVLTVYLSPDTTTKSPNMKTVVLFPDESSIPTPPIWTGSNSCFLFDDEQLEAQLNILMGQTTPVQTLYSIVSTPKIKYTCLKDYFASSPLNNITISIPTSSSLGFPDGYTMNEYVGINTGTTQYKNSAINRAIVDTILPSNISLDAEMYYTITDRKVVSHTSITTTFDEYDYILDFTNCILHTLFGLPASINIIMPASNIITNALGTVAPYIIDASNDAIIVTPKAGLGHSAVPPYTLKLPHGIYSNITKLNQAINGAFSGIRNQTDALNGLNMSQSRINITSTTCSFTYVITTELTENDYAMEFEDVSWDIYLGFKHNYYALTSTSTSTTSYAEVIAEDVPYVDLTAVIQVTSQNNEFSLYPLSSIKGLFDSIGTNNIRVTLSPGSYSAFDLYNEINTQLSNNPMTQGSFITTYYDNAGNEYTQMQLVVNQTYSSDDYELIFFDVNNVQLQTVPTTGGSVLDATKWDWTIGWLLGYQNFQMYNLAPTDPNNATYVEENAYTYNSTTGIITLSGNSVLDIYLYKDLYIILNDYTQNHMNDGVVTVESIPTQVSLPKSSNPAQYTYNQETKSPQVGLFNSVETSQILSQKRNVAANRINYDNLNNQTISKLYSSPPYLKDVFALIPLKPSSLQRGEIYAEFGGALQENRRQFFGPVNITKMSVQLVNDRGDIIDLNGGNWSFSIICDSLYNRAGK